MEIDQERQQRAKEYARLRRHLSYMRMGISLIALALILGLGLERWWRDIVIQESSNIEFLNWQPLPNWYPWHILLYFVIAVVIYEVLSLPFAYYTSYILPHRYGISVMSRQAWGRDQLLGFSLGLVLECAFITLVYALLAWQPQWWWLWVGLIILIFGVVMANLAPILLYPLFYKFTPLEDGELKDRLLALAKRANTHVRGVFTMHMSHRTTATNAALMGLGNTRRIVLGDTMIDRYTPDEIEVVLAHELGHHVHQDIWKLIFSQALFTLGGLALANVVLHWIVENLNLYTALTDPATILPFLVITGVFAMLVMPLSNGYSRRIEYQADEYALTATQKVDAFKGAMTRLANQNLAEIEPSPLVEFLFYSHPSIKHRLQHADSFAQKHGLPNSTSIALEGGKA